MLISSCNRMTAVSNSILWRSICHCCHSRYCITSAGHPGLKAEKRKLEDNGNPKKKAKSKAKPNHANSEVKNEVKTEAPESHDAEPLDDLDDDLEMNEEYEDECDDEE